VQICEMLKIIITKPPPSYTQFVRVLYDYNQTKAFNILNSVIGPRVHIITVDEHTDDQSIGRIVYNRGLKLVDQETGVQVYMGCYDSQPAAIKMKPFFWGLKYFAKITFSKICQLTKMLLDFWDMKLFLKPH
jgi:hypothetical protein